MRDLLLAVAVAAMAAFGWYLMGKVDGFLESGRQARTAWNAGGEHPLRIGFFDPMTADSLSGALAGFAKLYPYVSVSLFCGTEADLVRALYARRLDVAFLPETACVPETAGGRTGGVSLAPAPILLPCAGLPVRPVTGAPVPQKIVWVEGGIPSAAGRFVRYLQGDLPAFDRQHGNQP